MTQKDAKIILFALMIGGVFIFFWAAISTALLIKEAHGSSVCLTKHEARKLWPKRHIYWYSANHCWSNRRGGPPTGIKLDVIRDNHAESLPAVPGVQAAGKADRVVTSPPVRNGTVRTIPIVKEWKNDFEDYCCWPSLDETADVDRDRERAFRLLAEKMRKQ